jgi:hypothetical protein
MGAQGVTGVGVPPQPLWLLYIKIVILVLSLIVLALAGYALSVSGPAPTHPGGLDIFVVRSSRGVFATVNVTSLI